jgi:hypothetical protein
MLLGWGKAGGTGCLTLPPMTAAVYFVSRGSGETIE